MEESGGWMRSGLIDSIWLAECPACSAPQVMMILKLIVAGPFLMAMLFLYGFYRNGVRSVADFQVERVRYSRAYIHTSNVIRHSDWIIIEAEGKKFTLFPHGRWLPKGMTLKKIEIALNKSTEATIWTEKDDRLNSIRGIETKYLSIPPSQGILFIEYERRGAVWFSAILFVLGFGIYIYFKRYFGLNWKLDFDIPQTPY
jgi:hypothetical protein